MYEVFVSSIVLKNNLISLDEVEHCEEGASVNTEWQYFSVQCSFLISTDDAFFKKDPESPEPNNNNGFKGETHEMEPR